MKSKHELILLIILLALSGCETQPRTSPPITVASASTDSTTDAGSATTTKLFEGDLSNWTATNFGGEGEVEVVDGQIQLAAGYPMTGITWDGESLPKQNYEISLEAKKTEGNDFFCGLTFPVGEDHCSLILGGWGGSLVGLSCIDGDDASNNGTKLFQQFKNDQWYKVSVFVDATGIEVKLDGKIIIDQARGEHKFSVRNETLACRPMGICNFQTSSSIRNIVLTTFEN